jgi:2-(3-amino-3-carboxypropyl)histidine synthase
MYNLELDKAVESIKKEKAKTVVMQLPDGLKPKAKEIKEFLEKNTKAEILLWGGSCFGACDVPNLNSLKADLLIQFGHSKWWKND